MSQKKHPEFAQAKGAPAGFTLPAIVLKEANARYYFEDVPLTPLDIVLNEARGETTFTGGSEGANFDGYVHAGETVDFGIDEGVTTISVIAIASSTDVAVVEY